MDQEHKSANLVALEARIGVALERMKEANTILRERLVSAEGEAAENAGLKEQISKLEAQNEALTNVRDQLKEQLAQGQALMGKGSDNVSSLKERVEQLTNELAIKSEAVRALTTENERLKRRRADTLGDVDAILARVETIAEQVNG